MVQSPAIEVEKREAAKARRRLAKVGLNATSIERFLQEVLEVDWHVATLPAAQNSALGALPCSWFGRYVTWCVSLWRGLAGRCGLDHLGSS